MNDSPRETPTRVKRVCRVGATVLAQGEPMVWLTAGGLAICLVMIVGLLAVILYQGTRTFLPTPIIKVDTVAGTSLMGSVSSIETYELRYSALESLTPDIQVAGYALLHPKLRAVVDRVLRDTESVAFTETETLALAAIRRSFENIQAVKDAPAGDRAAFINSIDTTLTQKSDQYRSDYVAALGEMVSTDETGGAVFEFWMKAKAAWDTIQYQVALTDIANTLDTDPLVLPRLYAAAMSSELSQSAFVPMRRRLIRIGNYELTNEHFKWVSDFEVKADGESIPEWALVLERVEKGHFYGVPAALLVSGEAIADTPADIWSQFQSIHADCRSRFHEAEQISRHVGGSINQRQEDARLALRLVELDFGLNSIEWKEANEQLQEQLAGFLEESVEVNQKIGELRQINDRYQLRMRTADGAEVDIAVADIVRAVPANHLSSGEYWGVYFSRWVEFLFDNPREANAEGGVFPAIFGTVAMTLLMGIAVVPFGVLAALYLREYARAGLAVSIVRIAVNNLAGVPSIVFGVFGLGFFCYLIGAYIDGGPAAIGVNPWPSVKWFGVLAVTVLAGTGGFFASLISLRVPERHRTGWKRFAPHLGFILWLVSLALIVLLIATMPFFSGFYRARLPAPTFGTGGLMWASLTLSLLTLPVVIVATEEALAAVPRSMREGSLACGATKWQTIRRIVLPRALPGIMTGAILAMARGAGEVAPLMLVGAMKLAPHLPVDIHDWGGGLGPLPTGPVHPERSFMHLGFYIYDLGFQSPNAEAAKPMVFTTTLLLIALIATMNLLAIWLRARLRKKFQFSQF